MLAVVAVPGQREQSAQLNEAAARVRRALGSYMDAKRRACAPIRPAPAPTCTVLVLSRPCGISLLWDLAPWLPYSNPRHLLLKIRHSIG